MARTKATAKKARLAKMVAYHKALKKAAVARSERRARGARWNVSFSPAAVKERRDARRQAAVKERRAPSARWKVSFSPAAVKERRDAEEERDLFGPEPSDPEPSDPEPSNPEPSDPESEDVVELCEPPQWETFMDTVMHVTVVITVQAMIGVTIRN